jgi:hypothetical protein
MKKPNAASVYYFIVRSIQSCVNEDQLNNCQVLIDNACFYNYAFVDTLATLLLIRRCQILVNDLENITYT